MRTPAYRRGGALSIPHPLIILPPSVAQLDSSVHPQSQSTVQFTNTKSVFGPRCHTYLAAFNVRTLKQASQQAALAVTLDSLRIDVCCLSETRIQDSSSVTMLSAPSLSSRFHLRTSGDADADSMGRAGVGVVLSSRAEQALVEWIPVNSRLCAMRLRTSIKCSRTKNVERCLFIVSVYAPTDCSSDAAKDEFYDALEDFVETGEKF